MTVVWYTISRQQAWVQKKNTVYITWTSVWRYTDSIVNHWLHVNRFCLLDIYSWYAFEKILILDHSRISHAGVNESKSLFAQGTFSIIAFLHVHIGLWGCKYFPIVKLQRRIGETTVEWLITSHFDVDLIIYPWPNLFAGLALTVKDASVGQNKAIKDYDFNRESEMGAFGHTLYPDLDTNFLNWNIEEASEVTVYQRIRNCTRHANGWSTIRLFGYLRSSHIGGSGPRWIQVKVC